MAANEEAPIDVSRDRQTILLCRLIADEIIQSWRIFPDDVYDAGRIDTVKLRQLDRYAPKAIRLLQDLRNHLDSGEPGTEEDAEVLEMKFASRPSMSSELILRRLMAMYTLLTGYHHVNYNIFADVNPYAAKLVVMLRDTIIVSLKHELDILGDNVPMDFRARYSRYRFMDEFLKEPMPSFKYDEKNKGDTPG